MKRDSSTNLVVVSGVEVASTDLIVTYSSTLGGGNVDTKRKWAMPLPISDRPTIHPDLLMLLFLASELPAWHRECKDSVEVRLLDPLPRDIDVFLRRVVGHDFFGFSRFRIGPLTDRLAQAVEFPDTSSDLKPGRVVIVDPTSCYAMLSPGEDALIRRTIPGFSNQSDLGHPIAPQGTPQANHDYLLSILKGVAYAVIQKCGRLEVHANRDSFIFEPNRLGSMLRGWPNHPRFLSTMEKFTRSVFGLKLSFYNPLLHVGALDFDLSADYSQSSRELTTLVSQAANPVDDLIYALTKLCLGESQGVGLLESGPTMGEESRSGCSHPSRPSLVRQLNSSTRYAGVQHRVVSILETCAQDALNGSIYSQARLRAQLGFSTSESTGQGQDGARITGAWRVPRWGRVE